MSSKHFPELFDDARNIQEAAAAARAGFDNELRAVRAGVKELREALAGDPRQAIDERSGFAIEAAKIGTFTLDVETASISYSANFAAVCGFPKVETTSLTAALNRVHREDLPVLRNSYEAAARGENGGRIEVEFRFVRPGGNIRWMVCRARVESRVCPSGKLSFRIAGACLDITETKQLAVELRESERKLRLALGAAELGTWRWDASKGTDEIEWDRRCKALFGVPPNARVTHEVWANCIVPEDRDRAEAAVARALDPADPHDENVCDFRVRHPDGALLWLSSTGRAYFESNPGAPSGRRLAFKAGVVRDVTKVHLTEAALRESEERFRGVFDNVATGIAVRDMKGRFQSCNPAYSKMLSYSELEFRQQSFPTHVHPEDRDAIRLQYERLTAQQISSFEITIRYLRKDGTPLWVAKHVSLLRDPAGQPSHIIVLAMDITEGKRQEDQIRFLMREVNHSSKNMLSLVHAIARQTLAANPEDFLDRFGSRVEALAANQDLLVKNAWKGVDLDELVRSQLAPFEDLIGTRIALQGPPVFVSASAAQVIGMAMHELATNATKYGALFGSDGRVEIAWYLRGEAAKATFIMTWLERCAHPITVPSKLGFGSSVISKIAEVGLGAEVELNFPATGLTWQLSCAAAEVLDGDIRCSTGVSPE
ncbi:MAG: PAS domain-containing protein [Rhodomicrobium sp.]